MSNDNIQNIPLPPGLPALRDGNAGPADRSGATRQVRRAEERQAIKDIQSQQKEFNRPATKGELTQSNTQLISALIKMEGEHRKLSIRYEALLRFLVDKGVVDEEGFKREATLQVAWNQFIDGIYRGYQGGVPLRDLIAQVRQFNSVPENTLKVEWYHIDLTPRLIADEGMTLEEKLLVAAEMDMPEEVINALRDIEKKIITSASENVTGALNLPPAPTVTEERIIDAQIVDTTSAPSPQ